jgi:hypothetical protein
MTRKCVDLPSLNLFVIPQHLSPHLFCSFAHRLICPAYNYTSAYALKARYFIRNAHAIPACADICGYALWFVHVTLVQRTFINMYISISQLTYFQMLFISSYGSKMSAWKVRFYQR